MELVAPARSVTGHLSLSHWMNLTRHNFTFGSPGLLQRVRRWAEHSYAPAPKAKARAFASLLPAQPYAPQCAGARRAEWQAWRLACRGACQWLAEARVAIARTMAGRLGIWTGLVR